MENKKIEELKFDYIVGNDNGNSEHDIIINGKKICQPNVMAKIRKLPLLDEINPDYVADHIEDNLIVNIDSVSAGSGDYYIGKYALKSGERIKDIKVGVDNNKINSDVVIVNTLGQIAGFAAAEAYKIDKENIESKRIIVNVDMTTALPQTQYTKLKGDEFAKKFMKDIHRVTVYIGTKRIKTEINFSFVKVLPEGVPPVFAVQNLLYGKVENEKVEEMFREFIKKQKLDSIDGNYFKNKKILHVAIGEGTTEYPITEGIAFNPNFIHGTNNGIGHAIDRAIPEFKEEYGLLNYSRQEYSKVIRSRSHKYYDTAKEILDYHIESEADEIFENIEAQIQKANNEIDVIMIYGGGSILMKKILETKIEKIADRAKIKVFYVPAKFAVTLEAEGMYLFTCSNIFKKLKSMA